MEIKVSKRWTCRECHSNESLPKEHGCDYCQDFVNTKLAGRVYEDSEEYAQL